VLLLEESQMEVIAEQIAAIEPAAVVIDSIQMVRLREVGGRPGSVKQVRGGQQCWGCVRE
jgi:predicted ATP-dependent serine protease